MRVMRRDAGEQLHAVLETVAAAAEVLGEAGGWAAAPGGPAAGRDAS